MRQLPSRFRRLDDALADLPLEDPMLLTELDGFLTGVAVCPVAVEQGEWLQSIWGSDESGEPPFEDPQDVRWFVDAVSARYLEIVRDLTRGRPQPIFDIDERNGDVLWELWIDGFAQAMALRPDGWAALAESDDRDAADALFRLDRWLAIARNESALDSVEINALQHRAPADIADIVLHLPGARGRPGGGAPAMPGIARPTKVGRNAPCPCGSGKKAKRCCGG